MNAALMRPRTVYIVECRTCQKPWTNGEIDRDGNGPCCHTTKVLDTIDVMHLELEPIRAKLESQAEQIRVLKLANQSLGRVVSPQMAELLTAAQAWKVAIDLSAVLLVLISITGLILLYFVHKYRLAGAILGASGALAGYIVYAVWVP